MGSRWNIVFRPLVWLRAWRLRWDLQSEHLPPALAQFRVGEVIPLKGVKFRVALLRERGMVLAPLGPTRRAVHNLWAERRRMFRIATKEEERGQDKLARDAERAARTDGGA